LAGVYRKIKLAAGLLRESAAIVPTHGKPDSTGIGTAGTLQSIKLFLFGIGKKTGRGKPRGTQGETPEGGFNLTIVMRGPNVLQEGILPALQPLIKIRGVRVRNGEKNLSLADFGVLRRKFIR
jgi:hypothetical protein